MEFETYTKIINEIEQVEKKFQEIENNIMGSKKYWEGISGEKYRNSYKEVSENISTVISNMREKIEREADAEWKNKQGEQKGIGLRIE